MLWFREYTLSELNTSCIGTLCETLGIVFTRIDESSLTGTMPVDKRTCQPFGVLHGGASVALAETLGSYAANLCLDPAKARGVGQEINANHLRPVPPGLVTGVTRPIHLGRRSHVWEIRITDGQGNLACISRHTVAIIEHDPSP